MEITVLDHEGLAMPVTITGEYVAKALLRNEIVRTGDPLTFRLVRRSAMRALTPAERRRQYLASLRP